MWAVTAEAEEFAEAIDWFRKRIPVTTMDLAKYGANARDKAFWITGVAQLDVVAEVHASIIDALKKGTPFEEWQQSVSQKLTDAWGKKNAWRVETIYRNATQQAYITGRIEQLRDPAILKLRPFWQYLAIDDGRCPTGICPACNKVTLPPDHPWWSMHTPQLHHACRCRIDALRKETVEKQGGETEAPTEMPPADGFGSPPDLQTVEDFKKPIRKRVEQKVHPELVNEFDRKQVTEAPKPPPLEEMMLKAAKVIQALPESPTSLFEANNRVQRAVEKLEQISDDSVRTLSDDQRAALNGYSNGYDYEIRALQRGVSKRDLAASRMAKAAKDGGPVTQEEADKHVDEAAEFRRTIEKIQPTPIDMTLYRGISASSHTLAELLTQDECINGRMVSSTSAKPWTAMQFTDSGLGDPDYRGDTLEHRVIFVFPPGSSGIPMASDHISDFKIEAEVLLPANIRYRIVKREIHRERDEKYFVFHVAEIQ